MQAQWHVLPSLQFHNNCSFALTQPHPCMKLAELRGLVLRKNPQWSQDMATSAGGC